MVVWIYLQEKMDIEPEHAYAWYNKGLSLSKLGKYEDGIKSYDKALEIKLNYAEAWHGKANAFEEINYF